MTERLFFTHTEETPEGTALYFRDKLLTIAKPEDTITNIIEQLTN